MDVKINSNQTSPICVFASYSSADVMIINKFFSELKPNEFEILSPFNKNANIWGEEITKILPQIFDYCESAIIFVSHNYNESDWCKLELKAILKYHETKQSNFAILPIRIDDSYLPTHLSRMKYLKLNEINPINLPHFLNVLIKSKDQNVRKVILSELSDYELLEKVATQNNIEAFYLLYERLYPLMLRAAAGIMSKTDPSDLEDVLQNVKMRLWERVKYLYENKINMQGYVYGMTRNAIVHLYRSRSNYETKKETEVIDSRPGPDQITEQNELIEAVNKAMNLLSEHERLLIQLYSDGFSIKEVSEVTMLPQRIVQRTTHKALAKLRSILNTIVQEESQKHGTQR
jgi:RNA polymerase sigma factor (sigma-70 family)